VEQTAIPLVRRLIVRRVTSELDSHPQHVDDLLQLIGTKNDSEFQFDILRGMNEALSGWRKAPQPKAWPRAAEIVVATASEPVRKEARQLGVVFGDGRAVAELYKIVNDSNADVESRRSALRSMVDERVTEALPMLKKLLGDRTLMNEILRGFAAFDDTTIPGLILGRYATLPPSACAVAIDTLTSRPASARELLKAVGDGEIEASMISAYHARQILSFNDESLNRELQRLWGAVRKTTEEKKQRIVQLQSMLTPASRAAADASRGRRLFEKACSSCHVLYGKGGRIGPDLTGSNRHNLAYLLENIVDPSASVNQQFKVSVIAFNDGRVMTGVVIAQTERTISVQTQKEQFVLNRADIDEVVQQDVSLMPDGLLKQLTEQQIRDLFAYLSSRSQVPLQDEVSVNRKVSE
jgi:putative heme-binding domain-containing protein